MIEPEYLQDYEVAHVYGLAAMIRVNHKDWSLPQALAQAITDYIAIREGASNHLSSPQFNGHLPHPEGRQVQVELVGKGPGFKVTLS